MTLGEKEQEFLAALRVSNSDHEKLTCLECMQTQPIAAAVSQFHKFHQGSLQHSSLCRHTTMMRRPFCQMRNLTT